MNKFVNLAKKVISGVRSNGFRATGQKSFRYLRTRTRKLKDQPSFFSRRGVDLNTWEKSQNEHEFDFWDNIEAHEKHGQYSGFQEKYFQINKGMFTQIRLDFPGKTILDVGCGPYAGFLPYSDAKTKIGIDPLATAYRKKYFQQKDVLMLNAMAEQLPLLTESIDACFCINALDHMHKPYRALEEIWRVLKPGGYFAFATDLGGTKEHPVKIYETDLDDFFRNHRFKIIEKGVVLGKSSWGPESKVPLYVFQGLKEGSLID